jgi:hypothetical protein
VVRGTGTPLLLPDNMRASTDPIPANHSTASNRDPRRSLFAFDLKNRSAHDPHPGRPGTIALLDAAVRVGSNQEETCAGRRGVNAFSELAAPRLPGPGRSGQASGLGSFCSGSERLRCRCR